MRFEPRGEVPFQLERLLNNGLTFQDNLDGGFVEFDTTGARQTIQHGLGRKPIGFIVIFKDGACDIWGELLSLWTKDQMYLNASVASVTVRLFVL